MSDQLLPLKAGQLAFALDKSGMPQGFVVTKATLTGKQERLWRINQLAPKKWQLSLWYRSDGKPPVPHDEAYEVDADSKQQAFVRAREIIVRCEKAWNLQRETAFTNVPPAQQERWVDAWIQATKSEWPNLSKALKGESVQAALAADLIAHDLNANAVTVITQEICRVAAKTKITASDRLNLWLVANWFHGEKLAFKTPQQRVTLAKKSGSSQNEKSLGMRLRRLRLTSRNWSEKTRGLDIESHE